MSADPPPAESSPASASSDEDEAPPSDQAEGMRRFRERAMAMDFDKMAADAAARHAARIEKAREEGFPGLQQASNASPSTPQNAQTPSKLPAVSQGGLTPSQLSPIMEQDSSSPLQKTSLSGEKRKWYPNTFGVYYEHPDYVSSSSEDEEEESPEHGPFGRPTKRTKLTTAEEDHTSKQLEFARQKATLHKPKTPSRLQQVSQLSSSPAAIAPPPPSPPLSPPEEEEYNMFDYLKQYVKPIPEGAPAPGAENLPWMQEGGENYFMYLKDLQKPV